MFCGSMELAICERETRKENHRIHLLFLLSFRRKSGQIGCNVMSIRGQRDEESDMKYFLSPLLLVWSDLHRA
jgi:hypothetical protein